MQLITMIVLILYEIFLAPLLLICIAVGVTIFVLVQRQFGPISEVGQRKKMFLSFTNQKYGTLSHAPEKVGVLVPADSYAQPYMLPPTEFVELQFDCEQQVEQAPKEWQKLEFNDDSGEPEEIEFQEAAPLSGKPIARSEMIISRSNVNDKAKDEVSETEKTEDLPGIGGLDLKEEAERQKHQHNQEEFIPRKSPRAIREKSIIVDDLLSTSPRRTESGSLRARAPTSFFVVSPMQSRLTSKPALQKDDESDEMDEF